MASVHMGQIGVSNGAILFLFFVMCFNVQSPLCLYVKKRIQTLKESNGPPMEGH